MRRSAMKHFHYSSVTIVFCFGLLFLSIPFSAGQKVLAAQTAENVAEPAMVEPFTIKLSVNEVRLDVVVLDKKTGNLVTDLTADDFEVFQDDRRQKVLSAVYIDSQPDEEAQPAAILKDATNFPLSPTTALKQEDVRRTIIFVVDDTNDRPFTDLEALEGFFQDMYYTRIALRNFVEKQMHPGDLVSIIRTSHGNSVRQMFLSDKRQLLARIDAMRMNMAPDYNYNGVYRDQQLNTLSYSISALKDMPGRKILIMLTPRTTMEDDLDATKVMPALLAERTSYIKKVSRLGDEALRAGVVINMMNIRGLKNFDSNYADASKQLNRGGNPLGPSGNIDTVLSTLQAQRQGDPTASHQLNPLPAKTGGVLVENSNFFLDGVGKYVDNMMKGYYLVSYAPPSDTFKTSRKIDVFHRVNVEVKRRNVEVHTREGFLNNLENEANAAAPKHPLIAAIFSPFQHTDLSINMAAGYVKDAGAGYLVRSWIHLDANDVNIVETQDGGARIDFETLCLTSDVNQDIQDARHVKYTFNIEPENRAENIAWIRKHGIRFSLLLPVKKPGSYYVRVSIQDRESEKVGSAYQFIEIPDLGKKGLRLSNIFMITSGDDLVWMNSDVTKELAEGEFSLVFQADEIRSPALKTYMQGDNLQTLGMIYNAEEKSISGSEIEIQSVLYKDGREWKRTESEAIAPNSVDTPNSIPILQRLTINPDMPPGDYVLQLLVTDKKNIKKKEGGASQAVGFTVVEK